MDIPKLLAGAAGSDGLLANLVKPVSLKAKEKAKDLLSLLLQLDLDQGLITADTQAFQPGRSEKGANYFVNNKPGAAKNYLVQKAESFMNYWTGRPRGIMQNVLDFLPPGDLQDLLKQCREANLFTADGLNTELMSGLEGRLALVKEQGKKADFFLNDEKITPEKLLMLWLDATNAQKIVLIIPVIIKDGQKIILSTHPDYEHAVMAGLQSSGNKGMSAVCHICGRRADNINTVKYSSNLKRNSIGKVFVTTTTNYAPLFTKQGHQRNYAICHDCYEKISAGETQVMSDFKIKIAGEDAVLLFEGLDQTLDFQYIPKIKKFIDFTFHYDDMRRWSGDFLAELQEQSTALYEFHIVFYKANDRSCVIRKSIEDVSNIRFCHVLNAFHKVWTSFADSLPYFNLGSIYHMVPVMKNKKGEQVNIGRLLELYASIVKGEKIQARIIFELAAEALAKGLGEMRSSQVRNYKNLYKLEFLKQLEQKNESNKSRGKDLFIRQMMLEYLALLEVLQELKILDKEVLQVSEEVQLTEGVPEYIAQKEAFLDKHGFSEEARGLFYLGVLIYQVGEAQCAQGHATKPVLDKITYTGMNKRDIITLYDDIHGKLRQYAQVFAKMKLSDVNEDHIGMAGLDAGCEVEITAIKVNEDYMGMAGKYLAGIQNFNLDDEQLNVFYLISGYASCVPLSNKTKNEEAKTNVTK